MRTDPGLRCESECAPLLDDEQEVSLRPKSRAVLRYLMSHAGRVIGKEELLAACWPDVQVSPHALKVCVREIRTALKDDAAAPRFIETLPRQGYRFIAVVTAAPVPNSEFQVPGSLPSPVSSPQHPAPVLVGREPELAQLHGWLENALQGERRIVFLTGEPGIGKTALVDAFLAHIAADQRVNLARGQCEEHYGSSEAYLPVLQAVEQLCSTPAKAVIISLLRWHAPMWLVQMSSLLKPAEREILRRELFGSTRERMLREAAHALDALTMKQGLVLVLEDLHWSDHSTVELISFLARQRGSCRLLLIGTYRPEEVLSRNHPLNSAKGELQGHGQCQEIVLQPLSEGGVGEYLARRFSGAGLPSQFVRFVHQRTEGNPLFMINIIEHAMAHELLVWQGDRWEWKPEQALDGNDLPVSIQQLIGSQLARLSPQQQAVLEAASVAGMIFPTAAIASALGENQEQVEQPCEQLARQGRFLHGKGLAEWPDGSGTTQYEFLHALYQETLYKRIAAGRRVALHQRISACLEGAYKGQANAIAAELAMHCERGRDYQRAVTYHYQAGENALRRYAHQEAIGHFTKGLELLETLPETVERNQQERVLQTILGAALIATKGWAAPEVEGAYTRALSLCSQEKRVDEQFPALWGRWAVDIVRAECRAACTRGEQLLKLARSLRDPALLLQAHFALGNTCLWLGAFERSRVHLEESFALYDSKEHHSYIALYAVDSGVFSLGYMAWTLWHLGYPVRALSKSQEALTLAQELSHPQSLVLAFLFSMVLHQYRGEVQVTRERAEAVIALSMEQGFPFYRAWGAILRGWALMVQRHEEEGIGQIHEGMAGFAATGARMSWPHFHALLVEVYAGTKQIKTAFRTLTDAMTFAHDSEERYFDAELYRLKGELTLQKEGARDWGLGAGPFPQAPSLKPQVPSGVVQEVEEYFLKAIAIAQKQHAKSLELRAVMSLVRLRRQQAEQTASRTTQHETRVKLDEAHRMLSELYGWFTEGFDTKDLQEAKTLLEELRR